MTDLETAPSPASSLIEPAALGETVAAAMPALPGLQVEAVTDAEGLAFPNDEPKGVGLDLGSGARIVLVFSKAAARQVQVGPPPADDLLEACQEPLAAAANAAGYEPHGDPGVVGVNTAQPARDEVVVAARLLDADGGHLLTVALVVPAAAVASDDIDAPLHEFAPLPDSNSTLGHTGLELLHDVALGVTAELGRTRMLVKEVLSLAPGSVIELDRAAGSPVDVLVNGTLIARGEVVVIDEEFGIRITEVVGYVEGTQR